jgi:L-ascorbate metabolism protein UlaG (beta-lactamase superfamily)
MRRIALLLLLSIPPHGSGVQPPTRLSGPVQAMARRIEWLRMLPDGSSACVLIRGEKVIYIDPAHLPDEHTKLKADLILVTHPHPDHFDEATLDKLRKPTTRIVTVQGIAQRLTPRWDAVSIVAPGDRLTIGNISIEAIAAYNLNSGLHRKDSGWAGYVITLDGVRLYDSGDTNFTSEMASLRDIDLAIFNLGPPYQMSGHEVIKAAETIKPRVIIPVHWAGTGNTEVEYVRAHVPAGSEMIMIRER